MRKNDKINEIIKGFNDGIQDVLGDNMFVVDVSISDIQYYYCQNNQKIKVKTTCTVNKNEYIFDDVDIQCAFEQFEQAIANKINEDFTNSEIQNYVSLQLKDM